MGLGVERARFKCLLTRKGRIWILVHNFAENVGQLMGVRKVHSTAQIVLFSRIDFFMFLLGCQPECCVLLLNLSLCVFCRVGVVCTCVSIMPRALSVSVEIKPTEYMAPFIWPCHFHFSPQFLMCPHLPGLLLLLLSMIVDFNSF